jgi:hypothetical protein
MHFPVQIGLPQIILFLIAIVGLWLFISAAMGLLRGHERREEKEALVKQGYRFPRLWRPRRLLLGRGIGGILLMAVAVSLLWLTFLIQTYLGLTGEIKVAHIHAMAFGNSAHQMSVELIMYDDNGHSTSDNTYLLNGDEWMLQGDIVKFPTWLNVLGLHTGYKLTRLEGRFDDINMERSSPHSAIALNGGDDNFFKTAYSQQSWFGWFVDAAYGNAVFQRPGNYDVFATQDALIARPTS